MASSIVGREQTIGEIEQRLEQRNIWLLVGMAGRGKTALLQQIAELWQESQKVGQVFSFSYSEKAWSRQEILTAIASGLSREQSSSVLRSQVVQHLRAKRHRHDPG